MTDLTLGLKASASVTVSETNTAAAMKSGSLAVFATPSMCALMEEAACAAVNKYLETGNGTVGISLNISHERPTALGDTVQATAILTAVNGRKLTFDVSASDSNGIIGKGTHERFIINNEKFMAKLKNKA